MSTNSSKAARLPQEILAAGARHPLVRRLLLLLLALAVGGGLYLAGRWQAGERAAAERVPLEERIVSLQEAREQDREKLAAAQARARLLEARGSLFRAAMELDRRNFGTANQHVDAAGAELASISAPAPGIDVPALRAVEQRIRATDLTVAADLQTQRQQLLDLALRMGALIPAAPGSPPRAPR